MARANNIKVIQIAFNLDDPFQKKLYDYVKSQASNVSNYGRSLIQNDMMGSWKNSKNEPEVEEVIEIEDICEGFI